MASTISNFPQHVAIYRPAENGYQVLFIAEGKFQVLTSSTSSGVWFHVGKSKEFPQDDMFQIVRPADKDVYYWPTGFELVRNVPKSWPNFLRPSRDYRNYGTKRITTQRLASTREKP